MMPCKGQTSFCDFTGRRNAEPIPLPLASELIRRQGMTMRKSEIFMSRLVLVWNYVGQLDVQAMFRAMQRLVREHDIFRIHIADHQGRGMMTEVPAASLELETISARELQAELDAWERQEPAENEPLCSFRIFSTDRDRYSIAFGSGHELFDAQSLAMLLEKLGRYYASILGGKIPDPEPVPQFMSFAAWLEASLHRGEHDKSREFWHNILCGTRPVFSGPLDPDRSSHPLATVRAVLPLPQELVTRFELLIKQVGCTRFEGYFSLFNMLLAEVGDTDMVLTAIVGSLRRVPEFSGIAGCMLNRMYLPVQVRAKDHFGQVCERVHRLLGLAKKELLWPAWETVDPHGHGYPGIFFHFGDNMPFDPSCFEGLNLVSRQLDSQAYSPLPLVVQRQTIQENPVLMATSQAGFCGADRLNDLLYSLERLMKKTVDE